MLTANYGFPVPGGNDSFKAHRDFKALGDAIDAKLFEKFTSIEKNVSDQKYFINAVEFGAKGDASTDDKSALQAAINYAAQNNRTLFLNKSTFIISSRLVIPSNTSIEGNLATIKLMNDIPGSTNRDIFLIKDVSKVKISNLELDGNNAYQTQMDSNVYRGALIQNASDIMFDKCYFHDIQHPAIQVVGQTAGSPSAKGVQNLLVQSCTFKNVWCATQVTESDSKNVFFINNNVENTWEHGFTTYPGVNTVVVMGNLIKNSGLRESPQYSTFTAGCGIRIFETPTSVVSNNVIINPNYCGIRITTNNPVTFASSDYSIVSGNIVRGGTRNGGAGSGILIGEQGKSNNVIVANNTVENFTAYAFAEGIKLIGDHGIISGNRIKDVKQSGIVVFGNYNNVVSNNLTDTGSYGIVFGGTSSSDNCIVANNNIQTISQSSPISRGIYAQANGINVKASNNNFVNVATHYFNASPIPFFLNNAYSATAIPTAGTYLKGDRVVKSDPLVGSPKAWTCTTTGTMGSLNGGATTGSISSASATLVVNSSSGISAGQYLSIAGVTTPKKVIKVSGVTVTLESNVDTTVSNAAVNFSAATFVSEGNL